MSRPLALAFVLLAVLSAVGVWSASRLFVPADPDGEPVVFAVAPGEPLSRVAQRLSDAGLLVRAPAFGPRVWVLYARARGWDRAVKSGEYDLDPGKTSADVLAKLVAGEVKTWPVTLPEGLRLDEVAARLEATQITEAATLLELARDPEFVRSLGIEADSLEGYLYPETYRFRRAAPADEVLRRMVGEFEARLTDEDRAAVEQSALSLHEVVTLASIVEKETAVADERELIAGVFHNRLKRRMRLQSDPTVIYALLERDGSFDGNLRRRDLEADIPYNTYRRGGLPPGPIASPTAESIRAVLDPADVPYLYFVSRNDGTHKFSATLREHEAAVDAYQRRRRRTGPS